MLFLQCVSRNIISNGSARRSGAGRGEACDGLTSHLGESKYLAVFRVAKLSGVNASNDEARTFRVHMSTVLSSPS